ncbi:uncharacterized protein LOC116406462 [Xenopus tropicalis]|uniref:Uncharacterized protein LOC116406462 n=1 Tax=Xenopus tropicalis TaxID=8364 RepID=A0A8J1IM32_XENTR|nr:uncharacterized protein LOC116406462 [Xenopus tropicalis]
MSAQGLGLLWFIVLLCSAHCSLGSENVQWVPVSSDLRICGLTCESLGIYTLDLAPDKPILDFACSDKSLRIYSMYDTRINLNVSTGCCSIANAGKSDRGDYVLYFYGTDGKKRLATQAIWVIDPVCVTNISARHNGENVSVSVSYSGEEATVVWAWNGGALPERHQLSDSNKTLTVPSTDTGTFTALVSNPVSHSSAHYNLTLTDSAFACRSLGWRIGIIASALGVVFHVWCHVKMNHEQKD